MRVLFTLSVKRTCNNRPSIVAPSACKRGSACEWRASGTTSRRESKNTCSASLCETPCFSFFRALPSSRSKPTMRSRSITVVYYYNIHSVASIYLGPVHIALSWPLAEHSDAGQPEPRSALFAHCRQGVMQHDGLIALLILRSVHERKRPLAGGVE